MKELISAPIGSNGGKAALTIEDSQLVAKVSYPVAKILEPIKIQFVDKLKAIIPGTWDDGLIDAAWDEVVKASIEQI